MFDYRYHALSLAAVLFALALGVLIGVAIGDSNLVSSAKSGIVHDLNSEVSEARKQNAELQSRLNDEEAFSKGLYPLAVHELLNGRSVGLLFLGSSSDRINSLTRAAVTEAGGSLTTVVAVKEPLNLAGIAKQAVGTRYAELASSTALLERFGELVGRQLVSGGQLVDRELVSRVKAALFSAFDGSLTHLEGLVVMRADPKELQSTEAQASAQFEAGLLKGAAAAGVPPVGVELTSTEPTEIPWYKSRGVSSVDNLDQMAGQAALAYALAGAKGAFGVKSTADSLLPTVNSTAGAP
jgi:hypothetical protein